MRIVYETQQGELGSINFEDYEIYTLEGFLMAKGNSGKDITLFFGEPCEAKRLFQRMHRAYGDSVKIYKILGV